MVKEKETSIEEESKIMQLSCKHCDSRKLQLVYLEPEETETEIALLCIVCGTMISAFLKGTPDKKKEAKKTEGALYCG